MGPLVLRAHVEGAPLTLRVYAHRGATGGLPSSYLPLTFLLINLGKEPVALELSTKGTPEMWVLEGPRLDSHSCTINGILAAVAEDGTVPEFQPKIEPWPSVPPGAALFLRMRS